MHQTLIPRARMVQRALRACCLATGLTSLTGPFVGAQEPSSNAILAAAGEEAVRLRAAVLGRKITLHLEHVRLGDALDTIAAHAGIRLAYSQDLVPIERTVSLVIDTITVGDALTLLLRDTGIQPLVIRRGSVTLDRVDVPGTSATHVRARQTTGAISGRITDAALGTPLDQASVRVEGLGLGTVTSNDGRYSVGHVPSGTYRATARRVGYTPLTKVVTAATDSVVTVDFALAAAATKLNEVVTTAVGDQRRYEVGNVISTINADSIAPTAPITSLTDLISARAPGVEVIETGGLTGSGEAIRIRGQSSLVLQGDPIVIVDGVRQDNTAGGTATSPLLGSGPVTLSPSRLNDLDFNDIQSIDVLKGPAASTEYGTDAANGVIVITTKHGTAGRPRWQVSAEETASKLPKSFPTLYYSWGHTTDPTHTSVNCPLVPYLYGSRFGSATGTCAVDSVTTWNPLNNAYYSIFGTGRRQKYDLSVSGGSEAVRFFVSGGLSNETGVLRMPRAFVPKAEALGLPHSVFKPNGEDQRSVRANTVMRLGPTAELTVTGAYLSTYQQAPNAQDLYYGVTVTPALRDSATGYGYGSSGGDSPLYHFGQPTSQTTDRLTGGLTANWHPISWLVAYGTVGVDHGSGRATTSVLPQVTPLFPYYPAQLGIENATTDIYTADLRGSATAVLTPAVRAVTSIGLQLVDRRLQGTTATATGITATNVTLNGAVNPTITQLGDRQATLGGYAEEQVGLSDRLFVTGALRIDAGSGFGNTYSTAVYPKASVSWLALNGRATTIRLRGAFGESGVQPSNGAALQLNAPIAVWLNGGLASAVAIANVQNQRLRPERSAEYEGGVDVGLSQNRVTVELTAYSKTTHDALVGTGTGWDAGGFPYEENVGAVRNRGVEGTLTATVVQARALAWDISLNASVNRNTLLALAPGIPSQQLTGFTAIYRFAPGYPLYGYWAPRVQYADLNHDDVIEPNEVTVADSLSYAGSSMAGREASLGTHVALWNGALGVGALFDYRGGFRLLNTTAFNEAANAPQSDAASNTRAAPLWQQARDVGAEVTTASGLDGFAVPAGFYEDATYLRFRELSLTCAMPRSVVRALRVQGVSLTGAVRNLALWTRYSGPDPEVTNSSGANAQLSPTSNTYIVNNNMRNDVAAVPLLRYWVVRVNVGL